MKSFTICVVTVANMVPCAKIHTLKAVRRANVYTLLVDGF